MPKFLIERDIPGAGQLSAEELQAMSQKAGKIVADANCVLLMIDAAT